MRTIQDILRADAARLNTALDLGAATARIEVQCLLQHVLEVPRSYLLAHSEQVLNAAQQAAYDSLLQRRLRGEPVAYILGEREFFGLSFKVTPDTLIPRPETELLVELSLQCMPPSQPVPGGSGRVRVLDLGTGSGAIAICIAHGRPDADVVAVDASEAALRVATGNARLLGIANTRFVHSDWFSGLAGQRYNLIVSNPPYVAAGDTHLSRGDARFEPISALASGADGLDDIRRIVARAGDFLERDGWLLLEHGYDQADKVRTILQQQGFIGVISAKDIAGIERVSGGKLQN
ncbi:release factor glutamine methyltransferase [mine drainage metagenome]|uniref:peptide chain release factor N(5)-glutamine methyltransferase n=1 Tax=mine drainage metagenome TaxID=410659 RepID=A0A1J5S4J6_9ZZZZ